MAPSSRPLRVLFVEDSESDTYLEARELEKAGYKVIAQRVQTEAALVTEIADSVWDLILCDYVLPVFTAEKALEIVRSTLGDIPFIIISGFEDEEIAVKMLKLGVNDFIFKKNISRLPIAVRRELDQVGSRMDSRLRLERMALSIIEAWGKALELRDIHTKNHTVRVTDLTLRLARYLRLSSSEFRNIRYGSLLHDIGKMGIPDAVLLKRDTLDEDERAIIEMHPVIAYDMLSGNEFLKDALDIPYCHHEKWNGFGYPRRLSGDSIPLHARIFSVADVYDAITSDRPYRKSMPREEALEHIRSESGKSFDPDLVEVFLEVIK